MASDPARPRPRGVLFDFDGVIVESMPRHARAYREVLAPLGIHDVSDREIYLLEGKKSAEVIALLARARGRDEIAERADDLAKEKNKSYRAQGVAPLYPGAREVLARLREAGVPIALATGTTRANVRHVIGELADLFTFIVTADDVRRTKPNPEPYLRAAQAIGVPARECLVVENAPLGVQAGLASGARVAAVSTTLPHEDLWEAHVILPDLPSVLDEVGIPRRTPA